MRTYYGPQLDTDDRIRPRLWVLAAYQTQKENLSLQDTKEEPLESVYWVTRGSLLIWHSVTVLSRIIHGNLELKLFPLEGPYSHLILPNICSGIIYQRNILCYMNGRRVAQIFHNTGTNLLWMTREMTETKFKGKLNESTKSKYADWNNENIITFVNCALASHTFFKTSPWCSVSKQSWK
jgi:hypothetical protein